MDLFGELDLLPYYYYEVGDKELILGGHNSSPENRLSIETIEIIRNTWDEIIKIYNRKNLNAGDKRRLGNLACKMADRCEGQNMSRDELENIINGLSESEKEELGSQIIMYKKCREFYRDYVYHTPF